MYVWLIGLTVERDDGRCKKSKLMVTDRKERGYQKSVMVE